ncbi:transcription factor BIM1 [Carica papaya]|uniref:transcription factor BIM1 n=1 Tax=Carica papaya TaxID=3649 RepID=UPI000B8CD914|nr:transcription factor BIM1 [Carica papaya]
MELPQSRPFEVEGRKPTHDFLSLYSHSTVQQDPRPPSQGANYLKTHDFLQPLEQVGNTNTKEETGSEISTSEKPPPPAPPPPMEHILPGGIGTYSISHISYFNQRVPKPEGTAFPAAQASSNERNDENSNCSSYTGSGFTLWEESTLKKGKTGKENAGERPILREAAGKVAQWTTSERPSQSSSNNHRNSFSSLSSSRSSAQKSQSFMEMIKSAKGSTQEEDLDDDEEFVLKKEISTTQKGELRVKVDGKNTGDQKPNTPRSKHSATEQRRRSKINDRFQMLRELIPHSDQKRDKASFLLEVIEYIQFLQEKVQKYEGSYQGWNHEPAKLIPWKNNQRAAEGYVDQSRGIKSGSAPAVVFASKFDEKNVVVSPTVPLSMQNPIETDISTATTLKAMDHHPVMINKPVPSPMFLQPCFSPVQGGVSVALPSRMASDAENTASQSQTFSSHSRSCNNGVAVASDKLKEQGLTIEGGTISISTIYSRGLLNTLTQALQGSGVDLSQASISVQIELGKRARIQTTPLMSMSKDNEITPGNQGTIRPRVAGGEGSDQPLKKAKTSKS